MKHQLLALTALAALALAPTLADAGQVSFGGYYRFLVISEDSDLTDERSGDDVLEGMQHELQLKMDMSVSPKTHAHVVMRLLDLDTVEGANSSYMESLVGASNAASSSGVSGRVDSAASAGGGNDDGLNITQMWLETEMWGVGVKVGEMPVQLNDSILLNDDGDSSIGGILLSRTFPNKVTGLLGKFALDENTTSGPSAGGNATADASDDDLDLYLLSLLGSYNGVNWNLTAALVDGHDDTVVGGTAIRPLTQNLNDGDTNNFWGALTLAGRFNNVNWSLTGVYENGYDDIASNSGVAWQDQLEGSGGMVALRLNGSMNWGQWNAYAFYGSQDFDSINNRPNWSMLYNSHATDLMHNVLLGTALVNANAPHANDSGENSFGVGVGAQFKAGIWEITPELDYMGITEQDYNTGGVEVASAISGAWGGTLKAATQVDTDTTLSLVASYVSVDDNHNVLDQAGNGGHDDLHTLLAEISMNF